MSFKIGDVVKLKSGGPDMTVTYTGSDGKLDCTWFNREGVVYSAQSHVFRADTLKLVKPE